MNFIVSVISFLVYFDSQVHKKWGKNKQEKKMRAAALRHRFFFFFSLISLRDWKAMFRSYSLSIWKVKMKAFKNCTMIQYHMYSHDHGPLVTSKFSI